MGSIVVSMSTVIVVDTGKAFYNMHRPTKIYLHIILLVDTISVPAYVINV